MRLHDRFSEWVLGQKRVRRWFDGDRITDFIAILTLTGPLLITLFLLKIIDTGTEVSPWWLKKRFGRLTKKLRELIMAVKRKVVEEKPKVIGVDHEHKFKISWDGTHRACEECAYEEWNLACWTGGTWSPNRPENLKAARPDLRHNVPSANFILKEMPNFVRSFDIIPMDILDERINLIGAGAIGSFTALGLVKMGFRNIHIWDPQDIGNENIGTQLYGAAYVGHSKVGKLKDLLTGNSILGARAEHKTVIKITKDNYRITKLTGVVIVAVDSMTARKAIWKQQKKNRLVDWVIDARMGAEQAMLYTMNPCDKLDIESYEKTLYDDKDSLQEPCTAAGTAYTAMLISGMVCKAVQSVLTNKPRYPRIMHWNMRDNVETPIRIYGRPTDKDGVPVAFKYARKRAVIKKKEAGQPFADEPWAFLGKEASEEKSVAKVFAEVCEQFPFAARYTTTAGKSVDLIVIARGRSNADWLECKPQSGHMPPDILLLENNPHFQQTVTLDNGFALRMNHGGTERCQLLYAETLRVRGRPHEEIDRVMQPKPAGFIADKGEWKSLRGCFEELGSQFPFVVEWNRPGFTNGAEIITVTNRTMDGAYTKWHNSSNRAHSCHTESLKHDGGNFAELNLKQHRALHEETQAARDAVAPAEEAKTEAGKPLSHIIQVQINNVPMMDFANAEIVRVPPDPDPFEE